MALHYVVRAMYDNDRNELVQKNDKSERIRYGWMYDHDENERIRYERRTVIAIAG